MNFPEIVDLALPTGGLVFNGGAQASRASRVLVSASRRNLRLDRTNVSGQMPDTAAGAIQSSQKGQLMFWTMQRLRLRLEQSLELTPGESWRAKDSKGRGRR